MNLADSYDAIVIGSGPAGQNAAVTASRQGAKTLIVERDRSVGGACVQYGTIPSKTLRETAVTLSSFRRRSGDVYRISQAKDLQIDSLMTRLHDVVDAHQSNTGRYLACAGVDRIHGHAKFVSPNEIAIQGNRGEKHTIRGEYIFIATGSRPRNSPEFSIDHENILDSDSILSLHYLPESLVVLGSGVIACEYASTFASLGVRVTIIDKYPNPLGFLDPDLVTEFVARYLESGGRFLGETNVSSIAWDGVSQVAVTLESGECIMSDKALVAQGRIANTDTLQLGKAGLQVTDRGLIAVDENFRTQVPSVYAVGDAVGPPSLASSSVHQGRHAASHAFAGEARTLGQTLTPMGIYTIPEISTVGMDQKTAEREGRSIAVGRVGFDELSRGQIMATTGGFLKLVADAATYEVLGVQIVGEGATELVHLGQLAIASKMTVDDVAVANFNFPTLAEAYRLAALDLIEQRQMHGYVDPGNEPNQVFA